MMPWSPHARRRGAQRHIPKQLVDFALVWGEEIRQPGRRTAYHLSRKAIAKALIEELSLDGAHECLPGRLCCPVRTSRCRSSLRSTVTTVWSAATITATPAALWGTGTFASRG